MQATSRRNTRLGPLVAAALLTALGAGTAPAAASAPDTGAERRPVAAPDRSGGWQQGGLELTPNDNRAVDRFLARAERAEKSVSPRVRAAAVLSGAELRGFDQRLKSEDSLKRKVATWMKEDEDLRVNEALRGINDSVRYTFVWPSGRYTHGVAEASSLLAGWGDDSVRWANTWAREGGYKAVNAAWREPGGHVYEVQFHTTESKKAQEKAHTLYEEQRLPSTPPDRARELAEQQGRIFAAVPVPEGAVSLTAPADSRPVPAG